MNWRNLINRLHRRPRSLETDLDEEMALHRELKERELERSGLTGDEARYAAAPRPPQYANRIYRSSGSSVENTCICRFATPAV